MGLGLHGGGVAAARYLSSRGARVLVTDLRDEDILAPSLRELSELDVSFVLGRHRVEDFTNADMVIKNPGVPADSPYLRKARESGVEVETDVSLFLRLCTNPLVAVTGSKGKSTTATAIHHALTAADRPARLGGNITVSPLSFLQSDGELDPAETIVLELSSWQLGDLGGMGVLRPEVSVVTEIFADHMDRYDGDFGAYLSDKLHIVRDQTPNQAAVLNKDDPHQQPFASATRAEVLWYSSSSTHADGWIAGSEGIGGGTPHRVLFGLPDTSPPHHLRNLLAAALTLNRLGLSDQEVRRGIESFPGVEHRLELFHDSGGWKVYNDSAATVPEATMAAARSMEAPFAVICGGTDKGLDFSSFAELGKLGAAVYLLAGSGTEKIISVLAAAGVAFSGPYPALEPLLADLLSSLSPPASILFSPGCTSFGMFLNEFDRGNRFKQLVNQSLS